MEPGENQPISSQINKLQRTIRWLHIERLIMLGVIAGLLAMGPAAQWWAVAKQPLAAGERGTRWAVVRTFAGLRQVFHVQPTIDPTVVLEDEREAFGVPELGPNPAKPLAGKALASAVQRAARRLNTIARARSSARMASAAMASTSAARSPHDGLNAGRIAAPPAHASRMAAHPASTAKLATVPAHAVRLHTLPHAIASSKGSPSRAATLAAEGARIGRDLDKTLAPLPVDQSFQTLALANLSDGGPLPPATDAVVALPVVPVTILPDAVQSAAAASVSVAQPSATVAPAPVNLKALGYAEAADGSSQIVLTDGNALYVVNEGQEFLERFRVVSVRQEGIDVQDRLTHQTIHLSFGN